MVSSKIVYVILLNLKINIDSLPFILYHEKFLFLGETGRVAFDEMGDRMFAEYEIINVQKQSRRDRVNVTVGHYKYDLVRKSKCFNYWYYLG